MISRSPLPVKKWFYKNSSCTARIPVPSTQHAAGMRREHSASTRAVNTCHRNAAQTKSYLLWRPRAVGSWHNIEQEKPFLRLGEKSFLSQIKATGGKNEKNPFCFLFKNHKAAMYIYATSQAWISHWIRLQLPLDLRSFQYCRELAAAAAAIPTKMFQF